MEIKGVQILSESRLLNKRIKLFVAEDAQGQLFDILAIEYLGAFRSEIINKIINNEVIPLIGLRFVSIQKPQQVSFDNANCTHFIAYEHLPDYKLLSESPPTLLGLKCILSGLDSLKRQNRSLFPISPNTILTNALNAKLAFVGLFELFKQQELLEDEYLAPEVKEWLADSKKPRPNFQADIYSVFKCFSGLLEQSNDSRLRDIFSKALSHNRLDRYYRYSDILEELENVKAPLVAINNRKHRTTIRVVTKQEDKASFSPILNEMNQSCFILLGQELSEVKGQMTGLFSTQSYSGRFFVDKQNHIFVPFKGCNNRANPKVIKEGFCVEYGFDFDPQYYFDCYSFFELKWDELNSLAVLHETRSILLKKWKTLPDKEREFIEETAFKAQFTARELSKSNPSNVEFYLTKEFREWDKLKELKRTEVLLSVEDKYIGKIQDYHPTDCILTIKDAGMTIDEIPEKGELIQDVSMETGQFKKQVEAIKSFERKNVVNPALCSILASPEGLGDFGRPTLLQEDYEEFKNDVFNANLKTDETQRDAVLEALHTKPLYLIQGPPGTGKTTVIVELIQQIIKAKSDAKILVTSQSNLAVDNVLERLPETIQFMRLASKEEKISSEKIKAHSFQSKLKNWVETTQSHSREFMNRNFAQQNRDKALSAFYSQFSNLPLHDKKAFSDFRDLLRIQNQYVKGIFESVQSVNEAKKLFADKLGDKFLTLAQIQKDWFAFLANTDVDEGEKKKSMLRDGSSEVDFRTAFVKSVNVIGATCIHIASGLYSKVDFRFDYVIMDESSKASPAETLVPVNMGQNIILIGDHKQLPPVVTREEAVKKKVKDELEDNGLDIEKDFGESLFERLITAFEDRPELQRNVKMLDIQYRMPRQIGNLISVYFYNGKLKNPTPSVLPGFDEQKAHGLRFRKPLTTILDVELGKEIEVPSSVVFVSTSRKQNPYDNDNKFDRKNECNKDVIAKALSQLNQLFAGNSDKVKPLTIGIIAGYRGQVSLLKDSIDVKAYSNFALKNKEGKLESLIEINTVDKFQGAERDIIIYDVVKSSRGNSSIGFLDDYRRINVALSRVTRLLIIVGDSEYILKRALLNPGSQFKEFKLRSIVQELERQGVIVDDFTEILQ